jgi:hypothetical protein
MKSVFQKSATLLTLLVSTAVVSIPNRANAITIFSDTPDNKSGFFATNNPITLELWGIFDAHPGNTNVASKQVNVNTIGEIIFGFNEDVHGTTGSAAFGGSWTTKNGKFGFDWFLTARIKPGSANNLLVSTEAFGFINGDVVGTVLAEGVEVPWETDALPVVGSTVLFGLGVWTKRKRKLSNFSEKDNTKIS